MSQRRPSPKDLESFKSEHWDLVGQHIDQFGTVFYALFCCKTIEGMTANIYFQETASCSLHYRKTNWAFLMLTCKDRKMAPRDMFGYFLDEKFGENLDKIEAFLANTTFDDAFFACSLCGKENVSLHLTFVDFIDDHYSGSLTKSTTKGL